MSIYAKIKKKLHGFCLDAELDIGNERFGLLGASGCGKSMTLRCIAGIEKPDSGKIIIDGNVVFDSEKRIDLPPQKRNVGLMFQGYALFPNMTVFQNIASALSVPKPQRAGAVMRQISLLRLNGLQDRYPHQLSGGQQQRVALARLLAKNPSIILLDEPFSALDFHLKLKLENQLYEAFEGIEKSIVLVSHNRDEVYRFCARAAVMADGRAEHVGGVTELFKRPETVNSAKITGCRNISKIKKIDAHTVEALSWGITLSAAEPVSDDVRAVGIRAHMVGMTDAEGQNVFAYDSMKIGRSPFSTTVLFGFGGDAPLIWETTRYEEAKARYVYLPADQLLLLK